MAGGSLAAGGVRMTALRVATFNVRHCEGMDGCVDVERTAAAIRDLHCHLVALQEVDVMTRRSGMVNQALIWFQLFPAAT